MIFTRLLARRSLATASLIGASALALAACQPTGGEAGENGGEAGESGPVAAAPVNQSGESGEAGIASVYDGLQGNDRAAVRLQQLKGFFLAADTLMNEPDLTPAGVLVGQGILEVYEAFPADMAGYDGTAAQAAFRGATGATPNKEEVARNLAAALAGIDARISTFNTNGALIAARLVDVSGGLYRHVDQGDGVIDATEYQHSFGAALAARDALRRDERRLRHADARAYEESLAALDALIALWPSPEAPETVTPLPTMLSQGSRVQLALSSLQPG